MKVDEQIIESHKSVLLIDLENCPNHLGKLYDDLSKYTKVVICHAQSNAKIPLNWISPLSAAVLSGRLLIVKMEKSGKNSADFGICFFAGALMQEMPTDTHFTIISNDLDLDHAVSLLRAHGRSADRVGTNKSISDSNKPNSTAQAAEAVCFISYCKHLLAYPKNRPSKSASLINSIKSKCANDEHDAESVYKQLIDKKCLKINDDKISYDDGMLKKISNL